MTVGAVIRERALEFGEREYLRFESAGGKIVSVSYAEMDAVTEAMAGAFIASGLKKGDRILTMLDNSVECVVTMFACAKAGVIHVPLNTASVEPDIAHAVGLTAPRAFVAHTQYLPVMLSGFRSSTPDAIGVAVTPADGRVAGAEQAVEDEGVVGYERFIESTTEPLETVVGSNDVLQLLMTSGTTARPKAVTNTHANRLRSGYRVALHCRLTSADRSLTPFPAFHVNCIDGTLSAALVSGGAAVLLERFSAGRFWDQIRRHEATVVPMLPTVIRALLARPGDASDRDHAIRLVGAGLHITEAELGRFRKRFGIAAMVTGYGLTEASTGVLQTQLEGPQFYPSIGVPLFDREVALVDEDGNHVEPGAIGEIAVKGVPGRSIMLGYYGDPDATSAAIRDGWLLTGDLARADDRGNFYFVGRKKDMIKRSGENIAAQEVEAVIMEHPGVVDVAVVGVPDPYRDETVKAFVVLADREQLTLDELREHCAGKLAPFKLPEAIETLDDLPRSLLGKVDKKALRALGDPIASRSAADA